MNDLNRKPLASSFRDPSGYMFTQNGELYRLIRPTYFENYKLLYDTGLYESLISQELLVPHEQLEHGSDRIIIKPKNVSYVAYPYEWCFSQLKDAAINTLQIQLEALNHQMTLKDATAFNTVQNRNKSIFIDSLSFDKYHDGDPWLAYGQFCSHYLCPLLLWSHNLNTPWNLGHSKLEGSDIGLTSKLLPFKSYLSPTVLTNIHLHARAISKNQGTSNSTTYDSKKDKHISFNSLVNIIKSLLLKIESLELSVESNSSTWSNYYAIANYDKQDFKLKKDTVSLWADNGNFSRIWDIGANDGTFSRAVVKGSRTVYSSDIDSYAIEQNYRICKERNISNIVPFVANMAEPSGGYGYANEERHSLIHRMSELQLDCILALAVVHHLCLTENFTFSMLAKSWHQLAEHLIVEFVTPNDSWANHLLQEKGKNKHLFSWYEKNSFENDFAKYYETTATMELSTGNRILYFMKRK